MISVIIGTFGDDRWRALASERAAPSAHRQTVTPTSIHAVHLNSLHEARNTGAEVADGEYLIFLDADDELDENYVAEMAKAVGSVENPGMTLFQPSSLGVVDGVEDESPVMLKAKPMEQGNFLIIGTMIPRDLFFEVGGFQDWPAYEDWALFWRCLDAGAAVKQVPDAIYRVHVTPGSRNDLPHREAVKLVRDIGSAHRNWKAEYDRMLRA